MTNQPTATATVTPIKRASSASRAADKTTSTKSPATRTPTKSAANRTPAKSVPAKSAKLTITTAEKHIVADAMVAVCAKLAAGWNPKAHGGVSQETATQLLASWLNYAPLTTWLDALGTRSGAGGRGAKARKTA